MLSFHCMKKKLDCSRLSLDWFHNTYQRGNSKKMPPLVGCIIFMITLKYWVSHHDFGVIWLKIAIPKLYNAIQCFTPPLSLDLPSPLGRCCEHPSNFIPLLNNSLTWYHSPRDKEQKLIFKTCLVAHNYNEAHKDGTNLPSLWPLML